MLSAHKNLTDLCDPDIALGLFHLNDMSRQNSDKVAIQNGIIECDHLVLKGIQEGLCTVDSTTNKLDSISEWFMKPQSELFVEDFLVPETNTFLRRNQLHPFSFSGDIRDLDFSTYEDYPLSEFFKSTGRRDYESKVLWKTLENLTDVVSARSNLRIPDICRCNQLPNKFDALYLNNLYLPNFDSDGLVNNFSDGTFDVVTINELPLASAFEEGVVNFTDMDIASKNNIYSKFISLSNSLDDKMKFFEPTLIRMSNAIRIEESNLFSRFNFSEVDSNAFKDRLGLGSLHYMNSNDIDIAGRNIDIINLGEFHVPHLALQRNGGNRNNTDSTFLYQVVTDQNDRISNIPYDFFNLATPIDSNIALLSPIDDTNMGQVYVYETHKMSTAQRETYQTYSNQFAMSYRLFLKDAQDAISYTEGITNSVRMDDYLRENNIRVVNFETFSNTYNLNGLTPNLAEKNANLSTGLFSELTSNYLTSNMLRPEMNLGEIQLMFSNQLNNNLIDFMNRFESIVAKDTEQVVSSEDYDLIRNQLYILSNNQKIAICDNRDYLNNPNKRQQYLENIYETLELSRIAWSNDFNYLDHKPTDVSQYTNDAGYMNAFDPFSQYRNNYSTQSRAHANIGIGTLAIQDVTSVNIVCEKFDASYVHALSYLKFPIRFSFNDTYTTLLMSDDFNKGTWTLAPVYNFLNPTTPGLVRFTDNPLNIDNNAVLSVSNVLEKGRELNEEFRVLFERINDEYARKGRDVFHFINSAHRYLFDF